MKKKAERRLQWFAKKADAETLLRTKELDLQLVRIQGARLKIAQLAVEWLSAFEI